MPRVIRPTGTVVPLLCRRMSNAHSATTDEAAVAQHYSSHAATSLARISHMHRIPTHKLLACWLQNDLKEELELAQKAAQPPPDLRPFLHPVGAMEARYVRMLSALCTHTYFLPKITVSTCWVKCDCVIQLLALMGECLGLSWARGSW